MLKSDKRKVLIAPLDWGLGHATRCIPIIQELLKTDFEIVIAAEGRTRILLEEEFPSLTFLPLKGYNIRYGRSSAALFFKIFFQIPKILSIIRYEHRWLKKIISHQKIDAIISDNRYGLFNPQIQSVFITHQLRIKASFFSGIMQALNYRYINRFEACWIPDTNKEQGLAGDLSHPKKLPLTSVQYIGLLSRFKFSELNERKKHLLILLSGPEPQRTMLEEKLFVQLKEYKLPVIVVRGLPGTNEKKEGFPTNVSLFSHLNSLALQEAINQASFVIARSGYSTIMDLVKMKKKSILIPTPGQTEQEYLAKHLLKNRIALTIPQKNFDLNAALHLAESFAYEIKTSEDTESLKKAINDLLVFKKAN